MKIHQILLVALVVILSGLVNLAQAYQPIASVRSSDDRGLTNIVPRGFVRVSESIVPDAIQNQGVHPGIFVQVVRMVKNQPTAVPNLRFSTTVTTRAGIQRADLVTDLYGRIELSSCEQSTLTLQSQFKDSRYDIGQNNTPYKLQFNVPCKTKSLVVFNEQSPAGQVVSIFQVIQRAWFTLAQVSDFKFWTRPIHFKFPSDGDYYINDSVNLTLGYQWDVAAHEMGHAIYDQANIGSFGGGSHKIDECYSTDLALSEGWATFFAAWTHIDLREVDPKFEYLVPRRAPIRIETVPADVCGKSTNEWRVTAFFWDLLDINQDGEVSQVAAKKLWDDLMAARVSSVKGAADVLLSKGWNRDQVLQVWKLNFPAEIGR